ncbi:MAG: PhoH family protein [Gammaproteobacteria bacterium]|nr:PhoH family protein [Gammaproteobacteria bacterium]
MTETSSVLLEPSNNIRLANLCGSMSGHLREIEKRLGVEISHLSNEFKVSGDAAVVTRALELLKNLYAITEKETLTSETVHLNLQQFINDKYSADADLASEMVNIRRGPIKGRSLHQREYLRNLSQFDVTFGIGPAGTGKTYLAVAAAVQALEQEKVQRLVLVRPAVEAGEKLGFLPGDIAQKVDPYIRPIYDALYEMLGFQQVNKLIENNVIEIAPLAYMRGRSLNESFIILDEAQNTTIEQMKMFLTRFGYGSKVVVTGDITQIDLPREKMSGLKHAVDVLKDVDAIGFTYFDSKDVVRHPMVQKIVEAFEKHNKQKGNS